MYRNYYKNAIPKDLIRAENRGYDKEMTGRKWAVVAQPLGKAMKIWVFDSREEAKKYFDQAFKHYYQNPIAWNMLEISDPERFDADV